MLKGIGKITPLLCVFGMVQGCQMADPNAGATQSAAAAPATNASPVDTSHDPHVLGTWGNHSAGMMFQLAGNGAYQMQLQGNQMQGTWTTPQPGVIVFAVNGTTTSYQYQLSATGLGLQDPQGNVMSFTRVNTAPTPASTASAQAQQQAPSSFRYPARYQNYNAPVVAYFAETLSKQNAANVALGLRNLSAMDQNLLSQRGAFAEQLHWLGCQSDGSLTLFNWAGAGRAAQNCADTNRSWQNTYSLSSGMVTPTNCDQCARETYMSVVEFRCTVGLMSKQECGTAMQQMQNEMNSSHENSLRIINAMGGNNCICGDADCSC